MKKIFALVVILLVVMWAVPVLGEGKDANAGKGSDKGSVDSSSAGSENDKSATGEEGSIDDEGDAGEESKVGPVVRGLSDFGRRNREDAEKFREEMKNVKGDRDAMKKLVESRKADLRKNFAEAKERFKLAKEELFDKRENFREAKKELNKCKKGPKADECKDAEAGVIKKAKPFLAGSNDLILKFVEKLEVKIEASDLKNKEELLAKLDKRLAEIEECKEKVDTLSENSTAEDVKESAKALKNCWNDARVFGKAGVGFLVGDKMAGILVKAEKLEIKLDRILNRLSERGYDTSIVDWKVNEFDEKVQCARDKHKDAMNKFAEALGPGDMKLVVEEGHGLLKDAKGCLKDAHFILKEIVQEIKKADKDEEVLKEETEEKEVKVEIEGDLSAEQQNLVDSLVESLKAKKVNAEIEVEANIVNEKSEVKLEVKGELSGEQSKFINDLVASLEVGNSEAKIKIESEFEEEAADALEKGNESEGTGEAAGTSSEQQT